MFVNFEHAGDICILRMSGRFATGQDAEYLRGKTDELKRNGYRKVVADLGEVAYVDSTGIGFLIGIYTSVLRDEGSKFVSGEPKSARTRSTGAHQADHHSANVQHRSRSGYFTSELLMVAGSWPQFCRMPIF